MTDVIACIIEWGGLCSRGEREKDQNQGPETENAKGAESEFHFASKWTIQTLLARRADLKEMHGVAERAFVLGEIAPFKRFRQWWGRWLQVK
jgi:hypothetical protein